MAAAFPATVLVPAPAECDAVWAPYPVVSPSWKKYVVVRPSGLILALRFALLRVTDEAPPVVTAGEAAIAAAGQARQPMIPVVKKSRLIPSALSPLVGFNSREGQKLHLRVRAGGPHHHSVYSPDRHGCGRVHASRPKTAMTDSSSAFGGQAPGPRFARDQRRGRRQTLAGAIMLLQCLVLLVGALVLLATPHSVCHAGAGAVRTCGQSGGTDVLWVLAGALVVLVAAVALFADWRWASRAGLALSVLLATAGLAALAVTFADASHADRSTYGALWIIGLVLVGVFAAPVALLWTRASG